MVVHIWIVAVYLAFPAVFVQGDYIAEGDTGYDYSDYHSPVPDGMEPEFDAMVVNVTVVAGQTAVLPCSIDYLGEYKVVWEDGHSTLLTYQELRIVDDPRISVVRPYIKEWNLMIRAVRMEDQGIYYCSVNTQPVMRKRVQLVVKVSPRIIEEETSKDKTVREGDAVLLTCKATGIPAPVITWKWRKTQENSEEDLEKCWPEEEVAGEVIVIQNMARGCSGLYECVAQNGILPSASWVVRIDVDDPS